MCCFYGQVDQQQLYFMNNLASLRSQLLSEDAHSQEHKRWESQNFYRHHVLPLRSSLRTSDNKTKIRPLQTVKTSRVSLSPLKTKTDKSKMSSSSKQIGRNLFNNPEQAKIPGPGHYEPLLKPSSSHCYIKKQEEHLLNKIAKRMRKRALINECRGPGLYNPEEAFNMTSKNAIGQLQQGFNIENASGQALSQLGLQIRKLRRQVYTRTGFLRHEQSQVQNIQFFDPDSPQDVEYSAIKHNPIESAVVPGPGAYQWQTFFDSKKIVDTDKKPAKAKIQFKFVHGHPS